MNMYIWQYLKLGHCFFASQLCILRLEKLFVELDVNELKTTSIWAFVKRFPLEMKVVEGSDVAMWVARCASFCGQIY